MLSPALEEAFLPCATITSQTSQLLCMVHVSEVCSCVVVEPKLQQLTGEKLHRGSSPGTMVLVRMHVVPVSYFGGLREGADLLGYSGL